MTENSGGTLSRAEQLDDLTLHLIETTASAGVPFRSSAWASTVRYVIAHRQVQRIIRRQARHIAREVLRPILPLLRGPGGMFAGGGSGGTSSGSFMLGANGAAGDPGRIGPLEPGLAGKPGSSGVIR